jgi:hypothetical protein
MAFLKAHKFIDEHPEIRGLLDCYRDNPMELLHDEHETILEYIEALRHDNIVLGKTIHHIQKGE